MGNTETGKCGCPCHRMKGVLVILFGLTFLLGALDVLSQHVVSLVWPVIIIVAGGTSMMKGMCKCCNKGNCKIEDKKA